MQNNKGGGMSDQWYEKAIHYEVDGSNPHKRDMGFQQGDGWQQGVVAMLRLFSCLKQLEETLKFSYAEYLMLACYNAHKSNDLTKLAKLKNQLTTHLHARGLPLPGREVDLRSVEARFERQRLQWWALLSIRIGIFEQVLRPCLFSQNETLLPKHAIRHVKALFLGEVGSDSFTPEATRIGDGPFAKHSLLSAVMCLSPRGEGLRATEQLMRSLWASAHAHQRVKFKTPELNAIFTVTVPRSEANNDQVTQYAWIRFYDAMLSQHEPEKSVVALYQDFISSDRIEKAPKEVVHQAFLFAKPNASMLQDVVVDVELASNPVTPVSEQKATREDKRKNRVSILNLEAAEDGPGALAQPIKSVNQPTPVKHAKKQLTFPPPPTEHVPLLPDGSAEQAPKGGCCVIL